MSKEENAVERTFCGVAQLGSMTLSLQMAKQAILLTDKIVPPPPS
jgi:hypothetical protein